MKQTIIFLLMVFPVGLFAQVPTSRFNRYFQYQDGSPLTGAAIELVRQNNTYPTGAILLIEHPSRPGYYFKDGVGNGEYKIYIGGNLYDEHIWVGENRLSIIAGKFNSSIEMSGRDLIDTSIVSDKIKDQAIIWDKLSDAVKDSIRGAPAGQYLTANSVDSSHIKDGTVTGSDLKTIISGTHFYTVWAGLDGGYFTLPLVQQIWTPSQKFLMYKQENNVPTAQLRIILGQHADVNNGADTIAFLSDVRTAGGGGGGLGINTVDSTHIKNGGIGYSDLSAWTKFLLDSGRVATTGDDFIYGKICAYNDWKFARGLRLGYTGEHGFTTDKGELWFRLADSRFYGKYGDNDESDYFIMGRDLSGFTGSNQITTLGTITSGTWAGSTISINKGGTGATTKSAAFNNLAPTQTNKAGRYLRSDGTNISLEQITLDSSNTGGLANTLFSKYNSHKLFLDLSGDGEVQDTFPSMSVLRGMGLGGTFAIRNAIDYQESSLQDGQVLRWVAESPGYFVNDSIVPGFYNDSGKVLSNDGEKLVWTTTSGVSSFSELSDVYVEGLGPNIGCIPTWDGYQWLVSDYTAASGVLAQELAWNGNNWIPVNRVDSLKELRDFNSTSLDSGQVLYRGNERFISKKLDVEDLNIYTENVVDGTPIFYSDGGWVAMGGSLGTLSDGQVLVWDAGYKEYKNRSVHTLAKLSKSSFISNPTASDSAIIVMKTPSAIQIDSIVCLTADSSITINYYYGGTLDSLNNTIGKKIFSSNQIITNTTTGTTFTSFNVSTIPKNNFIMFSVRAVAGIKDESIFSEIYYRLLN